MGQNVNKSSVPIVLYCMGCYITCGGGGGGGGGGYKVKDERDVERERESTRGRKEGRNGWKGGKERR